ncbi:4602_t:CDS:2, partial [Acaulospora colombiana]
QDKLDDKNPEKNRDYIPNNASNTLLHRLAGPSTGKAGLAVDQTEITRIIAEASEGSKFYQNEKRKDEELNKKIDALLKQRDELLSMADIRTSKIKSIGAFKMVFYEARLELMADKMIAELEATRDLSQIIVHIDMDSFFASVEMLDDPTLVGKPFGVGGNSVLSTASYEARKFGVRSGMATYIAKKLCPGLIVVGSHYSRYSEVSKAVMDILRRFDPEMDPAGTDEAYLNITEYCETHNLTAEECVEMIRKTIHEETKLTASAGIAPNK